MEGDGIDDEVEKGLGDQEIHWTGDIPVRSPK